MSPRLPGRAVALTLAVLLALGGCGDTTASPSPAQDGQAAAAASASATPTAAPAASPSSSVPASVTPAGSRTPESTSAPTPAPVITPTPKPSPMPTPSPRPTPTPQLQVGKVAYVAVTMATCWHRPTSPRAVDAPALANPVRIRAWLAALSVDQQAGLIGRVDTQVLLGDAVLVTELTGEWARVVVPDQATPLDHRGYPVWIPRRQLTAVGPAAPPTAQSATVIVPTAWIETQQGGHLAEASFGTRLPALGITGGRVRVALPGGRSAWLASSSVSVRPRGQPALDPTAASVAATAKRFVGLRYLWGGTSGFGLDCSGIVYLVYRVHGIPLPRDADPQSKVGASVAAASRHAGDLVFFSRDGEVHHVAIWMGGGSILEAPQVGAPVRIAALAGLPYRDELSVTRRVIR